MKTESVVCEQCGKSFDKISREVKRSVKLKRKHYCSRSCAGKRVENISHLSNVNPNDTSHLRFLQRKDEFSIFRPHLTRAKQRNKEVKLTLQDLKDVFDSQNGMCAYSKVKLITVPKYGKSNPIYTMSLDRKDSSIGYIKSNIQFISISMNHLKNAMTEEQIQEMLQILREGKDSFW